jgi:division protein CdvB (Snf7/Vps24/ESCRT-III family)
MEKAKVEKVRELLAIGVAYLMPLPQAMKQGQHDMARIYAQNAIRKQQEKLNVMQLQSRIDAVASRVQTAVTMRTINTNMTKVNRALDVALKSMNPAKVCAIFFNSDWSPVISVVRVCLY